VGEIKVYSLGEKGVNVSNDPLHTDVGDVVSAQNATFTSRGVRGGLGKRLGMRVLNTVALAGAVLAIAAVTFTDPSPGNILTDTDLFTLTDDAFLVLTE
jgi:hypothetical protein